MKPDHIVLHCSATADSGTVSWNAIRKYHVLTLGWRDIGYHFGIELVGDAYEVLVGRWWDQQGAHCAGGDMNYKALGVCCVGDFDLKTPPAVQWNKCLDLVLRLCATLKIDPDNVWGHGEIDGRKSCPGLLWDMARFRYQLKQEWKK